MAGFWICFDFRVYQSCEYTRILNMSGLEPHHCKMTSLWKFWQNWTKAVLPWLIICNYVWQLLHELRLKGNLKFWLHKYLAFDKRAAENAIFLLFLQIFIFNMTFVENLTSKTTSFFTYFQRSYKVIVLHKFFCPGNPPLKNDNPLKDFPHWTKNLFNVFNHLQS